MWNEMKLEPKGGELNTTERTGHEKKKLHKNPQCRAQQADESLLVKQRQSSLEGAAALHNLIFQPNT